jgi:hypothetical protein
MLAAGSLTISLEVRLAPASGVDIRGVEVVALSAHSAEAVAASAVGEGQSTVELRLPGLPVTLTCRSGQLWCPAIDVADATAPAELPVFRSATVETRLSLPEGARTPNTVTIQGRVRGTPRLRFVVDASVTKGQIKTTLPSVDSLDLRFAAKDLAPVYFFNLSTRAGSVRLSPLRFLPGSSLSGIVVDGRANEPLRGVEASLVPGGPMPMRAGVREPSDGDLQMLRSVTSKDGFFQFVGVGPGRYRLELRSAKHPMRFVPVEIAQGVEVHLDEIPLPSYVTLHVAVLPPLDPTGQPWTVGVQPDQGSMQREVSANTSPHGIASFAHVAPGRLQIAVRSSSGARFAWESAEVAEDREIEVRIPVVEVQGILRRGSVPVAGAHVTIETGSADRIDVETDEDGKFQGTMRRPNPEIPVLMLDILERGEEAPRSVPYELGDPTANPLEIDIDLGTNHVRGIVVDGNGAPVAEADVSAEAENLGYHARVKTTAAGEFVLASVPLGVLFVRATHDRGTSRRDEVRVETDSSGPVTLELEPWREIKGSVLSSANAPVAGAEVRVLTDVAEQKRAQTDASGHFSLRVSTLARRVVTKVFAPSQLLWSGCQIVPDDGRLTIRLSPFPGGTLTLVTALPKEKLPSIPTGPVVQPFLVTELGGVLMKGDLGTWRRMMTGQPASSNAVPGLAAYAYGLLWKPYEVGSLVRGACSGEFGAEAVWSYLPPGGTLTIDAGAPPK